MSGMLTGIWKDTYITATGVTNFYNVIVTSGAFFRASPHLKPALPLHPLQPSDLLPSSSSWYTVVRELAVSPLLVQLRLTEDHRRRYLINRASSPKHHLPTDPPIPPEKWSHIRYRKLWDTGLSGGITALAAPRAYRELLLIHPISPPRSGRLDPARARRARVPFSPSRHTH